MKNYAMQRCLAGLTLSRCESVCRSAVRNFVANRPRVRQDHGMVPACGVGLGPWSTESGRKILPLTAGSTLARTTGGVFEKGKSPHSHHWWISAERVPTVVQLETPSERPGHHAIGEACPQLPAQRQRRAARREDCLGDLIVPMADLLTHPQHRRRRQIRNFAGP